jgi:hypothetical protein
MTMTDKVTTLHTPPGVYVSMAERVCWERDAARDEADMNRAAALGYRVERDEAQVERDYFMRQEAERTKERDEARDMACELLYANSWHQPYEDQVKEKCPWLKGDDNERTDG